MSNHWVGCLFLMSLRFKHWYPQRTLTQTCDVFCCYQAALNHFSQNLQQWGSLQEGPLSLWVLYSTSLWFPPMSHDAWFWGIKIWKVLWSDELKEWQQINGSVEIFIYYILEFYISYRQSYVIHNIINAHNIYLPVVQCLLLGFYHRSA